MKTKKVSFAVVNTEKEINALRKVLDLVSGITYTPSGFKKTNEITF